MNIENSFIHVAQQRVYLTSLVRNKQMLSLFWIPGLNELKKDDHEGTLALNSMSKCVFFMLFNDKWKEVTADIATFQRVINKRLH